ncbi:DUF2147 domain-containing protein [Bradyrhizobium sp. U87765 SZCCT0131]|uniref:DUF2147 domain-containing protein n=1 Tax=unclassified Bradyrhizobium TaxID=2631580 RepID=UPI001BA4DE0C|nr:MULTISPECIES: DUF2147 domain-containing protein [unclassified Bradyrhizobium]MBR1222226.1 DUF2147 domain-containing protein [Bradyrhizobium sp. U87765 SZCCT0131]MBR1264290.1 DUF2147 domain-containing protein [Bradyrhizobium sp. U87765 SZCCT0134]MBR1307927.1 DUF2147 domain-containing protein [Bradyrhizobium sp. U87765 SZCCT0110]MBR1320540.1 DUF2147 domain-containing protein [Bradyrhizobium sp. U87765 SZCCT0109]MBR1348347.1 DUF2147 domain-containing protein [Bradyrhizobium sp. U87765 SZCCT004
MRQLIIAGLSLLLPCAAVAADPQGEWLDAHGLARIRIADCNGRLWGATVWEKEPGGLDIKNPDPAKRSRPTLGAPLLLDMKPAAGKPDRWDGEVYDSENGKTYTASIRVLSPTSLEIKGCIAYGMLCGGETWTRVVEPTPPAAAIAATTTASATGAVKGKTAPAHPAAVPPPRSAAVPPAVIAKPQATATATTTDFCAAVIAAR